MDIKTIGILGAGQMGTGIARICRDNGFDVLLYDGAPTALERAETRLGTNRIHFVRDNKRFSEADFIIEAIAEEKRAKIKLLAELDSVVKKDALFVTNTSTIRIRELAEGIERKDKFMGMHFMNPPHILTLLETIRGPETSDETFDLVMSVADRLERKPILEAPDIRGFAVNGIVLPLINEAAMLLQRILCENADWKTACSLVDQVFEGRVKTGTTPMGVLSLADAIGIDTCVYGLRQLAKDTRHYLPHPILVRMLSENRLGRKTGEGFFGYSL